MANTWTLQPLAAQARHMLEIIAETGIVDAQKYFINLADKRGKTALAYAGEYQHVGLLDLLLARGADPLHADGTGWTVLHTAVAAAKVDAHASTISTILDHSHVTSEQRSKLLNATDDNGRTVIHIASYKDVPAITKLLLGNGSNPKSRDAMGFNPVALATKSGRRRCTSRTRRQMCPP